MCMYQVQVEQFSGPLEKLLELIEEKKMDITTISLAAVTGDFVQYIEDIKTQAQGDTTISARMLADFLVVASQLLLIKSKALLPQLELSPEEEESIHDLEHRLKLYSQLKPLFGVLKEHWHTARTAYAREFMKDFQPIFYPPQHLTPQHLHTALGNLFDSLGSLVMETEKVQRQIITLEEKINELFTKISNGLSTFSHLISTRGKEESIVLFLALLHLLRDRTIHVQQSTPFGEIDISMAEAEG